MQIARRRGELFPAQDVICGFVRLLDGMRLAKCFHNGGDAGRGNGCVAVTRTVSGFSVPRHDWLPGDSPAAPLPPEAVVRAENAQDDIQRPWSIAVKFQVGEFLLSRSITK